MRNSDQLKKILGNIKNRTERPGRGPESLVYNDNERMRLETASDASARSILTAWSPPIVWASRASSCPPGLVPELLVTGTEIPCQELKYLVLPNLTVPAHFQAISASLKIPACRNLILAPGRPRALSDDISSHHKAQEVG